MTAALIAIHRAQLKTHKVAQPLAHEDAGFTVQAPQ
jgi:hypothetical protein